MNIFLIIFIILTIALCIFTKIMEYKNRQERKFYHRSNGQFKRKIQVNGMYNQVEGHIYL